MLFLNMADLILVMSSLFHGTVAGYIVLRSHALQDCGLTSAVARRALRQ
jgi:hypothetical protein